MDMTQGGRKPSIKRVLELQKLLNSFADIQRVVHIKRHGTYALETDTEHSYDLAMTAWFLAEYFPELDTHKVIKLALVHDLVEIYAGDTFAFADQKVLASKSAREAAAQKRLAEEWQDFPSLHACIQEYETRKTPEACFVYALDKLMPMMVIYLHEGYTWRDKKLSLQRLYTEKMTKVIVSPEITAYWHKLHQLLLEAPHLFPSEM